MAAQVVESALMVQAMLSACSKPSRQFMSVLGGAYRREEITGKMETVADDWQLPIPNSPEHATSTCPPFSPAYPR